MKHLTDQERLRIVLEFEKGRSMGDLAKALKHCPKTLRRWINRYKATGVLQCAKPSGRKTKLSASAADAAKDLLVKGQPGGARAVARQLVQLGLTPAIVHKTTIIRHAKAAAARDGTSLEVQRGKPRQGLTKASRTKRLDFAVDNKGRQWKVVMFTDRKKFYLRYPGSKVTAQRWVEKGSQESMSTAVYQPTHPVAVNIYAGITPFGVTAVHCITGTTNLKTNYKTDKGDKSKSITKSEYVDVLEKTLLKEGRRLFTQAGIGSWVLQQDNDPAHNGAAAIVQQWSQKHNCNVQVLPNWPPNSPDLNLIENVWAWVQQKVDEQGCSNVTEFKAAIEAALAAVPKSMLTNLYKSMAKRLDKVTELGGERTKY